MQYLTYRSLLAKKQGKGFSEAEAKDILQQALYQLTQLHDRNQAHGSISLDTVAHDPNQMRVVLTAGNGNSNPIYLSPEVLQTKQSTPSADIYALGVVIIVLLTGMPPEALKLADGRWNWQDRCLVSDQFIQILNIALNPNRSFRYVNAAQMLKALQDLVVGNANARNVSTHISTTPTLIPPPPANSYPSPDPVTYQPQQPSPPPQSYDFTANNLNSFPQTPTAPPTFQAVNQGVQPKSSSIKKKLKIILAILGGSLLTGGIAFAGYWYYQMKTNENTLQATKQVSEAISGESVKIYSQILDSRASNQLLLAAKSDYDKTGSLAKLQAAVGEIPLESRVRGKAEQLLNQLQSEFQQNDALIKNAEKYYQEGKWQLAIDTTKNVASTPYWQERKNQVVKYSQDRIADSVIPQPSSNSTTSPPPQTDLAPVEQPSTSNDNYPSYDNSPPPPPPPRAKRPLFGPGSY